ncbi:MAG: MBL fold metallo-hydrolase [Streptosporangiaceae bacterium]
MRFTKLGHACVRLEKDGGVLVIDPGIWSGADALAGAQAVLVTHEHADHLDVAAVRVALAANPDLHLWANPAVTAQLAEAGSQVHPVADGDTFTAAGFDVAVHGRQHAVVHSDIPVIANTGFLVDGEVFHPGDAFVVPPERVPTLLLPVSAPWLKFAEMVDWARQVAPDRGFAIHDSLLSENGIGLIENLLQMAPGPGGGPLRRLPPGTTVEL